MTRHAFLIITHDNFQVLKKLLDSLSHPRIDIYLHFDAKVKELPDINPAQQNLYVLHNRIDTRWGDFSQIETEYALMESALAHGGYSFYHIISGAHFPLMPIEQILSFFDGKEGMTVFHGFCTATPYQENLKLRTYNLLTRHLGFGPKRVQQICQIINRAGHKVQSLLHITRNKGVTFYKASNWASFSEEATRTLIDRKASVKHLFSHSFCGDEFFAPTILMDSPLRDTLINEEKYLKIEMGEANPRILTSDDYDLLIHCGCMFARKFNDANIDLIDRILLSYQDN